MKAEDEAARESAVASALSSIKKEARFPHNVFVRAWNEYFFFESYRLFDDDFIEFKERFWMKKDHHILPW
jgi:hypothetical protein